MSGENWIDNKYPEPYKEVILDSLVDGINFGYYDSVEDQFKDRSGSLLTHVRGWQPTPESMTSFSTLKQKVMNQGSNLSVKGQDPKKKHNGNKSNKG